MVNQYGVAWDNGSHIFIHKRKTNDSIASHLPGLLPNTFRKLIHRNELVPLSRWYYPDFFVWTRWHLGIIEFNRSVWRLRRMNGWVKANPLLSWSATRKSEHRDKNWGQRYAVIYECSRFDLPCLFIVPTVIIRINIIPQMCYPIHIRHLKNILKLSHNDWLLQPICNTHRFCQGLIWIGITPRLNPQSKKGPLPFYLVIWPYFFCEKH